MKYYQRKDCRLCESIKIEKVLSLTPTPPADSYVSKSDIDLKQKTIPLDLYLCSDCGNAQLGHVIDAHEVYTNYIYETASTLGLGDHFKKTCNTICFKFNPKKGGLVVDIGSNDGILLKYFQDYGMRVLGIDPMPGIAEKANKNGIPTLSDFFNERLAKKIIDEKGSVSIISSNNLVADTDDLSSFIKSIKIMMNNNSIFFFETFYFYLQVKNYVWDFTYHEHYSYFTIKPLKKFFIKHDLEIIDVEDNNTKGGSMRVTLQLIGGNRQVEKSVEEHISLEENEGFQKKEIFTKYKKDIDKSKINFEKIISDIISVNPNIKIAGYGASATSTTLIYHFGMNKYLNYLVDDFTAKHNL